MTSSKPTALVFVVYIPPELHQLVFGHLAPEDLLRCYYVNTEWRTRIDDCRHLIRALFLEAKPPKPVQSSSQPTAYELNPFFKKVFPRNSITQIESADASEDGPTVVIDGYSIRALRANPNATWHNMYLTQPPCNRVMITDVPGEEFENLSWGQDPRRVCVKWTPLLGESEEKGGFKFEDIDGFYMSIKRMKALARTKEELRLRKGHLF